MTRGGPRLKKVEVLEGRWRCCHVGFRRSKTERCVEKRRAEILPRIVALDRDRPRGLRVGFAGSEIAEKRMIDRLMEST